MALAQLKIRIGAEDQTARGLRKAERSFRRSMASMRAMAEQLTLSLTLPFTGAAAAAIHTAGEFERLRNSLVAIMGDADAATEEMERLRKAALAPGLDFEQAVKGSVRLQAVGLSADQARAALEAFGNAITLAGGTASDLDGVTLALTQIISKGKVSAEEINQLAERVPQIRAVMKAAFGTADTEVLQKMQLDAAEFVTTVTAEMAKLPKAAGGISNSIQNVGQAVRQFTATLGEELNRSFNLQDKFDKLSEWLLSAGEAFRRLDDTTKRTLFSVAGTAAAIGPAIYAYTLLRTALFNVTKATRNVVAGLAAAARGAAAAMRAFMALNTAMKLTVAGAALAGVLALAAAFNTLRTRMAEASLETAALANVQRRAVDIAGEEVAKVRLLTATIKDETQSRERRAAALAELQRIAPEYFKGLSIEKSSLDEINKASERYIQLLLQRAKAQAIQERLVELERKRLDIQSRSASDALKWYDKLAAGAVGLLDTQAAIETAMKRAQANTRHELSLIDREVNALTEALKELQDTAGEPITVDVQTRVTPVTPQVAVQQTQQNAPDDERERIDAMSQGVVALDVGMSHVAATSDVLKDKLESVQQQIGSMFDTGIAKVKEYSSVFQQLQAVMGSAGPVMNIVGASLLSINSAISQGVTTWKEYGAAAAAGALQAARAVLMEAIARYIKKAVESLPFGLGLAIAAAGAASVGAIFNVAAAKLKIPSFAQGGIISAPTFAVVGDNPHSPEVVAPLHQLKDMLVNTVTVTGQLEVDGRKLVWVLDNTMGELNRTGRYG